MSAKFCLDTNEAQVMGLSLCGIKVNKTSIMLCQGVAEEHQHTG